MIKYQSEGIRKGEPTQHRESRRIIEFYLHTKQRVISEGNLVNFRTEFIKKHKLGNRFQGHSYDIVTQHEIIEIDGMNTRHSKKSQQINDGIAEEYIKDYHPQYKFYRLLQEEITDPQGRLLNPKDVADYLRANLF